MPSRIFLIFFIPHRFWRIVQLSEKQLPTNPAVGRLKNMVEEVKLTVPVVADLLSGTLTSRHWEELNRVLGMDMREQGAATFKQMMKVKLHTVTKYFSCRKYFLTICETPHHCRICDCLPPLFATVFLTGQLAVELVEDNCCRQLNIFSI